MPGVRRWIAAKNYEARYVVDGVTVKTLRIWHDKEDRV